MDEPGTSLFLKCLARLARQTQALATLRGMVGGKTLPLDDAGRGEAEYCGRAGCL